MGNPGVTTNRAVFRGVVMAAMRVNGLIMHLFTMFEGSGEGSSGEASSGEGSSGEGSSGEGSSGEGSSGEA